MKKYILSLFGLALLFVLSVSIPASAATTYTYKKGSYETLVVSGGCNSSSHENDDGEILYIEERLDDGTAYSYCYLSGSGYTFESQQNLVSPINVGNEPSSGTKGSLGGSDDLTSIEISDPNTFNSFMASIDDPGVNEQSEQVAEERVEAQGGDGEQATEESTGSTCEDKSGGWGWFLCPGVNALGSTLEFLDNIIASLLNTDESQFNTEGALYEGWKIMRNIAFFVLIPIGLVMILGTSLGFEVFSAYTIKKAFPRLLFAILFITFSWQLTGFAVEVTNSIGRGLDGIVTSPIRNSGVFAEGSVCTREITLPCFFDGSTDSVGSVIERIVTSAGSFVGFIGFLVFLYFYAGTLAIAFAIGMAVLLARQIALTAAILLAPLAILSWIFPGNDGLWKSWWNLFSKLLLMYPLIILLISSGKLFAWIVGL